MHCKLQFQSTNPKKSIESFISRSTSIFHSIKKRKTNKTFLKFFIHFIYPSSFFFSEEAHFSTIWQNSCWATSKKLKRNMNLIWQNTHTHTAHTATHTHAVWIHYIRIRDALCVQQRQLMIVLQLLLVLVNFMLVITVCFIYWAFYCACGVSKTLRCEQNLLR